ncbi:MAG: hypothetical protein KF773_00105 [Deltaproteobacteria bacterium]|nr:hypothetical protein [Deltaproteobacteria bacterium]MCW5802280.1 hypothetical protein [Deltaproteobacteria bacterium]
MKWLIAAALALAACNKGPSEEQCKQLLDHLVDLEFKQAGATTTTEAQKGDLAKMKATVGDAKGPEFMSACMDRTARDRVECAMVASDVAAVAKCDEIN